MQNYLNIRVVFKEEFASQGFSVHYAPRTGSGVHRKPWLAKIKSVFLNK